MCDSVGNPKKDDNFSNMVVTGTGYIASLKSSCAIMNDLSVNNLSIIPRKSQPSGHGFKVANFIGDINVTGVIDPTGLQFSPVSSNPSFVDPDNTIYIQDANGHLYKGSRDLERIFDMDATGLVPISSGIDTQYLNADGTWKPPVLPGTGLPLLNTLTNTIKGLTNNDSSLILADNGTSINLDVNDVKTYDKYYNAFPVNQYLMGESLIGTDKWSSGVLASNGKIYCVPWLATTILVIDPVLNTTYQIGGLPASNAKWVGCVLAQNGYVYGIPSNYPDVIRIDPRTDTFLILGGQPGITGGEKWRGGVLAPNGIIYAVPFVGSSDVLKIDTTNDTATTMGVTVPSGNGRYVSGSLAPNGKIYCTPNATTDVLVIDPISDTIATFPVTSPLPPAGFAGRRWGGSVYSPVTNKIYGFPESTNDILIIDPVTNTTSNMGISASLAGSYYSTGIISPSGLIYSTPVFGPTDRIIIINPMTNTVTLGMSSFPGSAQRWFGSVLAPNGKIYAVPQKATDVMIIETGPSDEFTSGIHHSGQQMTVPWEFALSKYFNKY